MKGYFDKDHKRGEFLHQSQFVGVLASRVIVKSGVYPFESSVALIVCCHLDTIFEFDSGYHFCQVIETT